MSHAEARAAREKINLSAAVGGASVVLAELEKQIAHIAKPSVDDCIPMAAHIVQQRATDYLREWVYPSLHGMWMAYCMETGPAPEDDAKLYMKDSWADALDDRLERFCEQYRWLLSADWLGRFTISNQLYSEKALLPWADAFAVEVYKNITFKHSEDPTNDEGEPKTPAQVLSAAGIVGKDIQAMLAARKEPTPKQVEEHKMSTLQDTVTKANVWATMTGMNDGQIEQLMDNASDSDDGLAMSGASMLGCDNTDIAQFRLMRSTMSLPQMVATIRGGVAPQGQGMPALPPIPAPIQQAASSLPPIPAPVPQAVADPMAQFMGVQSAAAPLPAEAAPAPAKRTRGGSKEAPGNAVPARCLAILKDNTGLKTEDLGAGLGVSRGTFDNYVKGKAHLIPTNEHLTFLRKLTADKIALLTEAQSLLPK